MRERKFRLVFDRMGDVPRQFGIALDERVDFLDGRVRAVTGLEAEALARVHR